MGKKTNSENNNSSNLFSRHLRTILRASWLQILLPKKPATELPKIVVAQNRVTAIFRSVVHIIPLSVALMLIIFNSTGFYSTTYFPSSNTEIQFAAKFLEVMMQGSIGAIFVEIIRHKMLAQDKIPLGSLFGPQHINDVSYLWSLDFWGSLRASWLARRQRIFLFIITFVMIVLAALVGPSGAVLMIPRPQKRVISQYELVYDSPSVGFPSHITLSDFSGNYSNSSWFGNVLSQVEPQLDYEESAALPFLGSESSEGEIDIYDNSDNMISSSPHRVLYYNGEQATAPMYKLARYMQCHSWSIDIGDSQATTFHQPLLEYACFRSVWNRTGDPNLPHGNATHINFLNANPEINGLLTYSEFFGNASKFNDTIFWLAIDAPSSQSKVSSLLVHGPQYGAVGSDAPDGNGWYLEACTIRARWISAMLNCQHLDRVAVSNIDEIFDYLVPKDAEQHIFLSSDFVRNLTSIYLAKRNTTRHLQVAFALALSSLVPPDAIPDWGPMENMTNGTAAIYNTIPDVSAVWATSRWTDPHELSRALVRCYVDAYGYDIGPVAVKLSLVVFFVYCVIVLVFLVYRLARGRSSVAWDTVSELFVLALNSHRPGHIQNTSGGLSTLQIFAEPVSVRANSEGSLEILFDHDKDSASGLEYRNVIPNEAY